MTPLVTRRAALAGAAAASFAGRGAAAAEGRWLLIDRAGIEAAKGKAARHAWAKAALDDVLGNAARGLKSDPNPPERGGQWPHWYSCKLDGVRLRTVSPTEHRCPKCNTVYTGDPYDAVVLYGVHQRYSRFIRDLGLAYRVQGDPAMARQAAAMLSAYAARYLKYPRHTTRGEDKVGGGRVLAQTLDESVWLIPIAWGYALVKDTMDAAARERVEKDLLVPAAEVIREHRLGIHNIQCWKNSAVACAGYAAGRDDLAADAIDEPGRGFRVQIAQGVTEEGMWYEGSLGYHRYTMDALWPLTEAARGAGLDLYGDRYRLMWEAPLALAFPTGDPPGFNDNGGGNIAGYAPLYELAFARWKRPEYGAVAAMGDRSSLQALLWGAESVQKGRAIPQRSSLLQSAGFAMLRAPGAQAAMRFGLHGGGHGHPDKLNIVTWGAGKMWGIDPGSINYGVPLHREWYRATIAHNTVAVDETQQSDKPGKLVEWKEGAISASADDVYRGARLSRSVAARAGALDDRFACSSDSERTWDWALHAPGRLAVSIQTKPREGRLGKTNGYQHIENVAEGRPDGDWWARWEDGGRTCTLRVKGSPGTVVYTGQAPGMDPASRVPVLVIRRRAASTVF
ncbi:MAG: heparinase II/III family protein, partial [Dehalococcoidia bacterium]|nr:heparinase II/III family protein [Dehalococcoidia bacterium]